ncbi:MAG: ABC transporter permease [Saprospiraceae bacterium]|nr:ABC transporter permease [Saprospiraceae bacterium]
MNKLWLIVKREYTTRVFKKSFILLTLLVPLAIVAFSVIVGFIMSRNTVQKINIAVSDPQHMITDSTGAAPAISSRNQDLQYTVSELDPEVLKADLQSGKYQAVIEIAPPLNIKEVDFKLRIHTDQRLDINTTESIKSTMSRIFRDYKIKKLNLSESDINNLDVNLSLDRQAVFEKDKKQSNASNAVGAILGGVMGLLMYIFVLTQGVMVMRSVMEEKMTRIVEVLLSSVKPIQLMMGKIIGVGAVGLTQLLIWIVFMPLAGIITSLFFGVNIFKPKMANPAGMEEAMKQAGDMGIQNIMMELGQINWWFIIPAFLLFFVFGYFLYASLCAAIGSAVGDDQAEAQQLLLPITLLIVMGLYLAIAAIRAPYSQLAVISSFIPFFAPMVMPTRLAFDPPLWQTLTSLVILAVSSYFFAFMAAKIYRTGILMYGKKASFKELAKWLFYK